MKSTLPKKNRIYINKSDKTNQINQLIQTVEARSFQKMLRQLRSYKQLLANSKEQTTLINNYVVLAQNLVRNHGYGHALVELKHMQNYVARVTLGLDPEPLPFRKVNNRGFPKVIAFAEKFARSDNANCKGVVNTLFRSIDFIETTPVKNVDSITAPYTGNFTELTKFCKYCAN
jgi:hypothetical protein